MCSQFSTIATPGFEEYIFVSWNYAPWLHWLL